MIWTKIAAMLLFLGVALGAFGSHLLRDKLSPHDMEVYKTAVLYHFIHALGLFAVGWLSTQTSDAKIPIAGILFIVGIALFSGSLYALTLTGARWLGAVTPLGGLCFLAAWIFVFLAAKG